MPFAQLCFYQILMLYCQQKYIQQTQQVAGKCGKGVIATEHKLLISRGQGLRAIFCLISEVQPMTTKRVRAAGAPLSLKVSIYPGDLNQRIGF